MCPGPNNESNPVNEDLVVSPRTSFELEFKLCLHICMHFQAGNQWPSLCLIIFTEYRLVINLFKPDEPILNEVGDLFQRIASRSRMNE